MKSPDCLPQPYLPPPTPPTHPPNLPPPPSPFSLSLFFPLLFHLINLNTITPPPLFALHYTPPPSIFPSLPPPPLPSITPPLFFYFFSPPPFFLPPSPCPFYLFFLNYTFFFLFFGPPGPSRNPKTPPRNSSLLLPFLTTHFHCKTTPPPPPPPPLPPHFLCNPPPPHKFFPPDHYTIHFIIPFFFPFFSGPLFPVLPSAAFAAVPEISTPTARAPPPALAPPPCVPPPVGIPFLFLTFFVDCVPTVPGGGKLRPLLLVRNPNNKNIQRPKYKTLQSLHSPPTYIPPPLLFFWIFLWKPTCAPKSTSRAGSLAEPFSSSISIFSRVLGSSCPVSRPLRFSFLLGLFIPLNFKPQSLSFLPFVHLLFCLSFLVFVFVLLAPYTGSPICVPLGCRPCTLSPSFPPFFVSSFLFQPALPQNFPLPNPPPIPSRRFPPKAPHHAPPPRPTPNPPTTPPPHSPPPFSCPPIPKTPPFAPHLYPTHTSHSNKTPTTLSIIAL
ncbi:hypothetical protein DSO57_1017143 [Entomophthora muscae]|uniref:Uncharacterized protein n=1 Tax=Entomophthora muscae TaxID=34485 RepID=A0ACC2RJE6_9FUNG|nr:hypothetical protein DSO57_1017143 [Entomophthora muscae]